MADQPTLDITKDGSSSLYSHEVGQLYHSRGGAITESKYVYFELSGLEEALRKDEPITVLEVGFGTGLNIMIALHYYQKHNCSNPLHFYSIEASPITSQVFEQLNYAELLGNPLLKTLLLPIFSNLKSGLNTFKLLPDKPIYLHLFIGTFDQFVQDDLKVDFIMHDAFSPEVNGELWTPEVFSKLNRISSNNGVLTTYCSASKARAAMAVADWKIARTPGVLGKREMTMASLNEQKLSQYKRVDEKKLAERYLDGAFD
ncbi:MAG: tRNA (5-methylaminomethyl-2-thiouridine)(34)-methyltransferase MnmD [Balneolaceae bacterium]